MIEYEDITIGDYNDICCRIDKLCAILHILKCYTEIKSEKSTEILNIDYLLDFAVTEIDNLSTCL